MAKYEDYCIKSKGGKEYERDLNSTMQSAAKQRWVLCNFSAEKNETYNYQTDNIITRFDFSNRQGKEVVCKFISLDMLKYFRVDIHSFYIKITDFEANNELYFCSNRPIFSNAIFNKKGIYFSFVVDSSFVYIFRSKNKIDLTSVLECEREFIKAQTMLNNLPRINVKSNNSELDEIVNKRLPHQIIQTMFQDKTPCKDSFKAFATLSKNYLSLGKKDSKVYTLVQRYFDLLKTYYGVEFGDKGIYLSSKKDKLIDSKIYFRKGNNNFCLDIKNANLNSDTFRLKNIEYSGTNYLPYNKLSQSLILQM